MDEANHNMPTDNEVSMQKVMRLRVLFALLATIATGGAMGCVGSGSGSSGMDGGGFTGGTGGSIGGSGGGVCFSCGPNCFDCGRGCECSFIPDGSIGPDNDGGVIDLPWTGPFTDVGDDGTWRSTGGDTLCMGGQSLDTLGVWSDERGVYVMGYGQFSESVFLGSGSGGFGAAPPPLDAGFGGFGGSGAIGGSGGIGGMGGGECFQGSFGCAGRAIYFNDGIAGWRKQLAVAEAQDGWGMRFSGIPLGELVVHRTLSHSPTDCTLRLIDGSTERCDHSGSAVEAVFAVDAQLAYATVGTNLLVYDGSLWSVHPTPIPFTPTALWATSTDVVAVGDLGRIARLRDGVWTSTNHGIELATAVWGGEGDELWIGTAAGEIMRRDALGMWVESLHLSGVTCARSDAIVGIWGVSGTVYFHTDRALAAWDGSTFRSLANWTCALADPNFGDNPRTIRQIWGHAPNELFIAVSDLSRSADPFRDPCGNGFVMYFDGTTFHRL